MGVREITVAENWSRPVREKARRLLVEHGVPSREAADFLEWGEIAEGERVRLRRDGLVEETVPYAMPAERVGVVGAFGGRLFVDLYHEEVTAISESEEVDRLILNLMHDIVIGAKTRGQAWEKYEWGQQALRWHWPDPYLTQLHFHTDKRYLRSGVPSHRAWGWQQSTEYPPYAH